MKKHFDDLHRSLGWQPPILAWAKCEILFGLAAMGVALLLLQGYFGEDGLFRYGGIGLFALSGYLVLAGHRSHLYRSMNTLTAYLASRMESDGSTPP